MLPFNTTKTVMGIINELIAIGDITPEPIFDSTLNNKYLVAQNISPNHFPTKIRYFGIGTKGFKIVSDQNSAIPYKPDPRNMDLYNPIPFRCVPKNNDLDSNERELYRMRVLRIIDDEEYWCYYLKKIEYATSTITSIKTDLLTGEEEEITLDFGYLNPTPTETATPAELDDTEEYNTYIDTILRITGQEINEVVQTMFNNDFNYAKISEIGLYSGEDQSFTDDFDTTYLEAIYTQLVCHECNIGTDLYNPANIYEKILRITQSTGFVL